MPYLALETLLLCYKNQIDKTKSDVYCADKVLCYISMLLDIVKLTREGNVCCL